MVGSGGAVSSVDRDATQVGIDVLARGGNAADAAVATAAALGVTEPYSAGIGGGGFLVYYDAETKKVSTIDGRETAPVTFTADHLPEPRRHGAELPRRRQLRPVGRHPGHAGAVGQGPLDFGTWRSTSALKPAERLAEGFVVDQTFRDQTAATPTRFRSSRRPPRCSCPTATPAVGSAFTNPDMATAYRSCAPRASVAVRRPPGPGDRRRGPDAPPRARRQRHRRAADDGRPRGLPRAHQGADPLPVQGFRRLRHVGPELGRDRRGGDPQPHRAYEDARHRNHPPSLDNANYHTGSPRPRRRRSPTGTATSATSPRAGRRADQRRVRGGAGLPARPEPRPHPADPVRRPGRLLLVARPGGPSREPARARRRPTSSRPTSGAMSRPTRSPSSRPAGPGSPCPARGSCSTTS